MDSSNKPVRKNGVHFEGKSADIPQIRPWDDRTHPPPDPITIMKTVGKFKINGDVIIIC
jgi:hypothetical protein